MNDHEQEKLWAYYQKEGTHIFDASRPRYDFIVKKICSRARISSLVVLNIGSGDGYFEIAAIGKGWNSYSLDPDKDTIQRLKTYGIEARQGLIERMPFQDEMFDFVVASEVIEHLSSDSREIGFLEVCRVLKPGGWLLGTTPYKENLQANEILCPHCGTFFHRWGHQASFDLKDIRTELQAVFTHVSVHRRAFVSFRERSLWRRVKGMVRLCLAQCGMFIAGPRIFFEASKSSTSSIV